MTLVQGLCIHTSTTCCKIFINSFRDGICPCWYIPGVGIVQGEKCLILRWEISGIDNCRITSKTYYFARQTQYALAIKLEFDIFSPRELIKCSNKRGIAHFLAVYELVFFFCFFCHYSLITNIW